jgi:hypothetical protein
MKILDHIKLAVVFATGLGLAAGCATNSKNAGPKYVFFPPAPDAPHVQYLTSFGSEKDLRGGSGGSVLAFVTGQTPPENPIAKPYGAATSQGKIYVCDTGFGTVWKLDLQTRRMTPVAARGAAALKAPLNVAIDADGTTYIVDSGRDQVVILDRTENLIATLGEQGQMKPRDVALTKDRIYVSDLQTRCVHVYDKATRTNLFNIPNSQDATNVARKLFQPLNLAVDSDGRLFVSDFGAFRVQVFDAAGNYLRTVGSYGDNAGEFSRVKGIAVDRENHLYAVDSATQVVQMFDDHGQLLMWFGDAPTSNGALELPSKVVVDYDDVHFFQRYAAPDFKVECLLVVINQYGPHKVSVFGFGAKK